MSFLKTLFKLSLVLLLIGAAGLAGGWFWFDSELRRPGPASADTVFVVEPGEPLGRVAARLENEGLVHDARVLRLQARLEGSELDIKSGEYVISAGMSANEVLAALVEGRSLLHKITIPEGLTTAQVLRLIAADDKLEGDLPEQPPPEGSLLPDTYLFHRGMTRGELIRKMQEAQAQVLEELWPARQEGLPFNTPEEAIILASVVEKETGKPDERDEVAGLFVGRLKSGMRLQSDPTIIYGISGGEPLYNSKGQRRGLFQSEIERPTDWNTYQIDGLPKTPIANPGRDAIAAVLNPPKTDYVFFVAECKDGVITGKHVFSKTLEEHNRAAAIYRDCAAREIDRERMD